MTNLCQHRSVASGLGSSYSNRNPASLSYNYCSKQWRKVSHQVQQMRFLTSVPRPFDAREVYALAAEAVESGVSQHSEPVPLGAKDIPKSAMWELDFCSRPVLDERGKKLWELIICDPDRNFEFARYFPNNKINSTQLKKAIQEILAREGAVKPDKVRFFRGQMQTIIGKALTELEIKPVPSRRCFTLTGWLSERIDSVYKAEPTYSSQAQTLFTLDLDTPQELPDALRGESWCFVQLPLSTLLEESAAIRRSDIFGDTFDLATAGLEDLSPDTIVPGVCVFSRRAIPLSAWSAALDLAELKADTDRACLILESGVNQRWRYGAYRRTRETTAEAQAWEEAKAASRGLHFLAVQEGEEADGCAGLWLMLERQLPSI